LLRKSQEFLRATYCDGEEYLNMCRHHAKNKMVLGPKQLLKLWLALNFLRINSGFFHKRNHVDNRRRKVKRCAELLNELCCSIFLAELPANLFSTVPWTRLIQLEG
jgi:hypothetical protein